MESMEEELQMKMGERRCNLQRQALLKHEAGVYYHFPMQLKKLTTYLEVVAEDGRSVTSYGIATSTSSFNSSLTVDLVSQSASLSELVISAAPSLGKKFKLINS